jgi:putative toxin-antitoxin system antitoxin component (TIGR02293 family)
MKKIEIFRHGLDVFDNKNDFKNWLNSNIKSLNYEKPKDLIKTEKGLLEVNNCLGRIEWGIY